MTEIRKVVKVMFFAIQCMAIGIIVNPRFYIKLIVNEGRRLLVTDNT